MVAAVEITGLAKSFGSKQALHNVSLTIPEGEIYGFLGPNGAGKTTTIRCLMDFIRPDAGTVTVFGHDSRRETVAVKQLIGYMPAENQLYANWTGRQHMELIRSIRGGEHEWDVIIKRLGLDESKKVRHLSTGNKQKLGLALAMMTRPKLLVLDEPTRGLDPLLQNEIYDMLERYRKEGGTALLSSHNLAEVDRLCDQVGIIRAGEVVASESIASIKELKTHVVTATFSSRVPTIKLENVEVVSESGKVMVLKARGDINPLMMELGRVKLKDLEITHASLEDVFIDYYRTES